MQDNFCRWVMTRRTRRILVPVPRIWISVIVAPPLRVTRTSLITRRTPHRGGRFWIWFLLFSLKFPVSSFMAYYLLTKYSLRGFVHKAATRDLHSVLFFAHDCNWPQLQFSVFICFSTDLRQVSFGRPVLLFPMGVHVIANIGTPDNGSYVFIV